MLWRVDGFPVGPQNVWRADPGATARVVRGHRRNWWRPRKS